MSDLPDCPAGLEAALRAHRAQVVRVSDHRPRVHVRLGSADGPLFAWYSTDPADRDVLAYEVAVRDLIGEGGALRAPPMLARGDSWRLERMVAARPVTGRAAIETIVMAWATITGLELPERGGAGRGRPWPKLARRARLALSPLAVSDVMRARRLLSESRLPAVASHGDFHVAHVLPVDGAVYVIDWELAGARPAGLDLMQLWASLPAAEDRASLLDAAVGLLGEARRSDLLELRYVALVQRIASKLAEHRQFGTRDPEAARALLALLPEVRAEALRT